MSDSNRTFRNARREAGIVLLLWMAALAWTIFASYRFGYGQPNQSTILGIPQWVVVAILAPWAVCTVATVLFSIFVMKDDDLGREQEADHA